MKREDFEKMVEMIAGIYGVASYLSEEPEDFENPWFICPECGEPIYYSDHIHRGLTEYGMYICPVCEEALEVY